jgi:hypothetical protein
MEPRSHGGAKFLWDFTFLCWTHTGRRGTGKPHKGWGTRATWPQIAASLPRGVSELRNFWGLGLHPQLRNASANIGCRRDDRDADICSCGALSRRARRCHTAECCTGAGTPVVPAGSVGRQHRTIAGRRLALRGHSCGTGRYAIRVAPTTSCDPELK